MVWARNRHAEKIPQLRRKPRQAKHPLKSKPGVPPGRGNKKGMKAQEAFVATDEQRVYCMQLVACGFTQDSISVVMNIPIATLERHFAWELSNGKLMIDAKVLTGIASQAMAGDKTMSIFYAKARTGWRDIGPNSSEPQTVFAISINNGAASDAAPEIQVIARPIHSLPEPEEQP